MLSIILLLIIFIFSLRYPTVQNFVKDKLVNYLENKIKTDVELEYVYIDFPNSLVMKNLLLKGEDVDTLLYTKKLDVSLNIWQLLKSKADISSIELEGTRANIIRRQDGSFNFDYIINAFTTSEEEEEKDSSKPFIISLDKIHLKDIGATFIDKQLGNDFKVYFSEFDTRIKKFDLQDNSYAIDKIKLDGLKVRLKQNIVKEIAKNVEEKVDSISDNKPLQLKLGAIDLSNFDVQYHDDRGKMYADVQFKTFETEIKAIDLAKNKFDIGDISLAGLKLNFKQKSTPTKLVTSTKQTDTTSTPFQIALNKINLEDINLNYADENSRMQANVILSKFDTKINQLDLAQNKFDIGDINLNGLDVKFLQQKNVVQNSNNSTNSSISNPMQIALGKINVSKVNADYKDENQKIDALIKLDELSTKIKSIDLANNQFQVDEVILKNSSVNAKLHLAASNSSSTNSGSSNSKPLQIVLDKGIIDNLKVNYVNTAAKKAPQGFDPNYIDLTQVNVNLYNFKMNGDNLAGQVLGARIVERNGINVQNLRTNFMYASNQAYLKKLYLQTPKTVIRDEVILRYNSLKQLTEDTGNVVVNANLKKSRIAFADILYLAPDLKNTTPFKEYPNAILAVDSKVYGKVNDLNINRLNVYGIGDLKIAASGKVKNAMNPDRLSFDLNVQNLSTSSKTLYSLIPKDLIPDNIKIPSNIAIKGTAKGTTSAVNTNLSLVSTLGNANINANVDMRKKDAEKYSIKADLKSLDVGKLITNPDIGKISGNFNVDGTSFNLEKADAKVKAFITQAQYNQYNYQNINLNANVKNGVFDADIKSDDANANLNLAVSGIYKNDISDLKINGTIDKLDVQALGFYKDPLTITGEIDGNFETLNLEKPNGSLYLKNFTLADANEKLLLNELKLNVISTDDLNEIVLNSQVIDAEIRGKYNLLQLAPALMRTINNYYKIETDDKVKIEPNQYFTFNASIKNDKLIQKFVPDLKEFSTINIQGDFNSDEQKINLNGKIEDLKYADFTLKNTSFELGNQNDKLNFDLALGLVGNESFKLENIFLNGDIAQNIINFNARAKDNDGKNQFLIAGNVNTQNNDLIASLNPDGLILNYDQWQVSEGNFIQVLDKGIIANNFKISNQESSIEVNSETNSPTSPLNIAINNFKIETITELVKVDQLPASGIINGTAQLKNLTSDLTFNADLNVSDLKVYNNLVGNLDVNVKNKTADIITAGAVLTGNNNTVRLNGDYNLKDSLLDFELIVNRFEMNSIQGFTKDMLADIDGFLVGKLDIKGKIDEPKIEGFIGFNQVGFSVPEYGVNLRNINDQIRFTNGQIDFNRFRINDKDGNSLTLNGQILIPNFDNIGFNLDVRARDFRVINSEKSANAMTYGILAINTDLRIRGNLDLPVVNGNITVTENTDFTFVMPQSTASLQSNDGIVKFIDPNVIEIKEKVENEGFNNTSNIEGINLSVNIEIVPEAKTTIIIDQMNGDTVLLQGEAQLTGGMDPSGRLSLTGVYEVEKGSYEMSVSLIKRKFEFRKGSTITWTGEPTSANLDLTAVYRLQAAPIDLIEQQLTGLSSTEVNMYRQRIPFNTELKLGGELMKPIITFDITLDEDNYSVASSVVENTKARLNQLRNDEAEMNKQVFALLLLNRFIGTNPFQSQSGVSAETMARQSVSNLLSDQLNNLAADLIQGVDINLGLNTQDDYSSGERNTRTDLNVEVSKRLLNDRLTVTIGSNFGLDGDARQNENMTNIAGDVTVEYALSKDGRYMLRAYRKNEYQVALQGQIIETGVGFIITLDYNKFREIFENKRKKSAYKKQMKNETW